MSTRPISESPEPGSSRRRAPPRFRTTRIAVLVVLVGLWVAAVTEIPRWVYHRHVVPGSPRPDIALVRLEPRIGLLPTREALISHRRIVWDRPAAPDRLVLFTARGVSGEPAVRLATEDPERPGTFHTLGYAVRGSDTVWRWSEGDAAAAIEEAERRRRARPAPEESPSLRQG